VDQIFAVRSILGKCYEYNTTLHQILIDFKQEYDSINREKFILILKEFKIPRKLINLIGMTLPFWRRNYFFNLAHPVYKI